MSAVVAAPPTGPISVNIQCRDGQVVLGSLNKWDANGFSGDFGTIGWDRLSARDARHLIGQLVDPESVDQWLIVGRVMKSIQGGEQASRHAYEWAHWMSRQRLAEAQKAIDAFSNLAPNPGDGVAAGALNGDEHQQPSPKAWVLLHGDSPEAMANVGQLKRQTVDVLAAITTQLAEYENNHFLLYTDLPEPEARQWLEGFEDVYKSLAMSFGAPPGTNIFWGKAVILFCSRFEDFQSLQQKGFKSAAPPEMGGMTHSIGPKVIVTFWKLPDERKLKHTVAHEITHAFLRRMWTSAELPLWFEEGFADYVAAVVTVDSPIDEHRWGQTREFVLSDGPIDAILDMHCMAEGWPGPRSVAYGVTYYLVRTMYEINPSGVERFIADIKMGKDWEHSLGERFGMTRNELISTFRDRIRNMPEQPPPAPTPQEAFPRHAPALPAE